MAEALDDYSDMKTELTNIFETYVEKALGRKPAAEEKKAASEKAVGMLLSECLGGKYKDYNQTSVFPSFKDKKNKLPVDIFVSPAYFQQLAWAYFDRETKAKDKKPAKDDTKTKEHARTLAKKIAEKSKEPKKDTGPKVNDVTKRLTDTKNYTASHKLRFDEEGKGKGKEGRVETASNTGYVGNYKGEGTYDKKK